MHTLLIVVTLAATLFARVVSVMVPLGIMGLFIKKRLKFNEILLISFGGTVRGAIAFGLALQIGGNTLPNLDIIKTTVQIIVLISTVVFGGMMGPITQQLKIETSSLNDLSLPLLENSQQVPD